jgi:hypothetical protein
MVGRRAVLGAAEVAQAAADRLEHVKKAADDTAGADPELRRRAGPIPSCGGGRGRRLPRWTRE